MKVLFDTNVFVSYLLRPDKEGTVQEVLEAGFEGKYTILLPQEEIEELKGKLLTKSYLKKRIPSEALQNFITALMAIAKNMPSITEPIPRVSRDKKDDYLLACAVVGVADYLVSGDRDLQVLKKVGKVAIVSPLEFLGVLK